MDAPTVEKLLLSQGISLAPGRAEKLAPGVNALNVDDPLRKTLPFDVDPTSYTKPHD